MTWKEHHEESERVASKAEVAQREGRRNDASELYLQAAKAERQAFDALSPDLLRTRSITAVSTAALFLKADAPESAALFASQQHESGLQGWANSQLDGMLDECGKRTNVARQIQELEGTSHDDESLGT